MYTKGFFRAGSVDLGRGYSGVCSVYKLFIKLCILFILCSMPQFKKVSKQTVNKEYELVNTIRLHFACPTN